MLFHQKAFYNEKSAVYMMYKNLLCKILLKASFKSKLNINIIHFDFAFHAVLIQNVSSFKAVKMNLYFLVLIEFYKNRLCISIILIIYSATIFFISFAIIFFSTIKQ